MMNIPLFITTRGDAVLELMKLKTELRNAGVKIIKADTYSFTADDGMIISKVYWDGGFIVSDIALK